MIFTNQENSLATAIKYALKPGGSWLHNQKFWVKKAIHIASKENIVASKVTVRDVLACVHNDHGDLADQYVELAAQLYSKRPVKERVTNVIVGLTQLSYAENQDNPEMYKLQTDTIKEALHTFETISLYIMTQKMIDNSYEEHKVEDLIKNLLANTSGSKPNDPAMSKKLEEIANILSSDSITDKNIELLKVVASSTPVRDLKKYLKMPEVKFGKVDIDVKFEKGAPSIIATLKINENNIIGKGLANFGKNTGGVHVGTDDFRIPSPVNGEVGIASDGSLYVEADLDVPGSGAVSTAVKAIGLAVDNHHEA